MPHVIAERCVHSHIEHASCRVCVQICPRRAWQLDEDGLSLDPQTCDHCELCAMSCPQGALVHEHQPALRQLGETPVALIACERGQVPAGEGVWPCLHALGDTDLLKLYRQGIRALLLHSGQCRECPRYPASHALPVRLRALNLALEARECPPLRQRELEASQWQGRRDGLSPPSSGPRFTRRGFFGLGLRKGLELRAQYQGEQAPHQAPGQLLPERSGPLPHVPHINPDRCQACDACVKLCPRQALRLDRESPRYLISPESCTGCGICLDTCPHEAVEIRAWHQAGQREIPLIRRQCPRCGAPFHQIQSPTPPEHFCFVCRHTPSSGNRLYQQM